MNEEADEKKRHRPGAGKNFDGRRETARETGRQNLEKLLLWVYRWGWTTEPVLQKLLGVKRRPGSDLVKRGVLTRIDPPAGHRPAYVIQSGPYLTRALELFEEETGAAIPYPYPRTSIPFSALGEHNHVAQLLALDEIGDGWRVRCARELTGRAIPDFVVDNQMGGHWHEVELTPKYRERLIFQLEEREKARAAGDFDKLFFWCRTGGIARNLRAALSAKVLPKVTRRADGKIVVKSHSAGWNPRALFESTEISVIGQQRGAIPAGGQIDFSEQDTRQFIDDL